MPSFERELVLTINIEMDEIRASADEQINHLHATLGFMKIRGHLELMPSVENNVETSSTMFYSRSSSFVLSRVSAACPTYCKIAP
jgi:hypothetical protein